MGLFGCSITRDTIEWQFTYDISLVVHMRPVADGGAICESIKPRVQPETHIIEK
jgi:hypothetical protein